ncbi:MAG TPA: hypothetical protein VHL85_00740 [Burkholderiales bacterium]|jgi:hypothetical protein|nr:hypothetical protein [Burkholderiales bacterium]
MELKREFVSLRQATLGLVFVLLVLAGIGGTIYKVISPNGWIAHAFGRSFSAGAAALGSLLMIIALAWFSRGRGTGRTRHRFSDLFVYTFAAAGALYLAQLWLKGSF